MKIGIITVQKAPNYGAVLQCYALQFFFRMKGGDCEVIDLCRPYHKEYIKSDVFIPYGGRNRSFLDKLRKFYRDFKYNHFLFLRKNGLLRQKYKRRNQYLENAWIHSFNKFNERIIFSKKYKSVDELYENPPVYDIYITGSDQLWNPTQNYSIEPYFLTFVKNGGKKVSYSTSIGQECLPKTVMDDYVKWLKDYDFISLREQSSINLLQPLCDKKIYRTVDPTILIPTEEWKRLSIKPEENNYVFCYTLHYSPDLLNYARQFAYENNKQLIYWIHDYRDEKLMGENVKGRIDISPEEWLGYIEYADFVISDSFHGSVFSILFQRQFITYIPSNNTRGNRIVDLLGIYGLQDRLILDLSRPYIDKKIDYVKISQIVERERNQSIAFLNSIIL